MESSRDGRGHYRAAECGSTRGPVETWLCGRHSRCVLAPMCGAFLPRPQDDERHRPPLRKIVSITADPPRRRDREGAPTRATASRSGGGRASRAPRILATSARAGSKPQPRRSVRSGRAGAGGARQRGVDGCARLRADGRRQPTRSRPPWRRRARQAVGVQAQVLAALVKGTNQGWIRRARATSNRAFEIPSARHGRPDWRRGCLCASLAARCERAGERDRYCDLALRRLTSNTGTMTKSTHCGYAASLGLDPRCPPRAALLATRRLRQPARLCRGVLPTHFDRAMPPRSARYSGWSILPHAEDFSMQVHDALRHTAARAKVPSPAQPRRAYAAPVVPTGDRRSRALA